MLVQHEILSHEQQSMVSLEKFKCVFVFCVTQTFAVPSPPEFWIRIKIVFKNNNIKVEKRVC